MKCTLEDSNKGWGRVLKPRVRNDGSLHTGDALVAAHVFLNVGSTATLSTVWSQFVETSAEVHSPHRDTIKDKQGKSFDEVHFLTFFQM